MFKRITSLSFDLDGTLTDPREGIVRCIANAQEQLGRESPEEDELERYTGCATDNMTATRQFAEKVWMYEKCRQI